MRILIVSATEKEIKPLLKRLSFRKNAGTTLKKGKYRNMHVDVLISGIGMVSTAYHCGKMIGDGYDCVINAGIAGSFKKDLPVGTVVNVIYDRFSELGAEAGGKFLTFNEIGLKAPEDVYGFVPLKSQQIKGLKKVKGITVNTVHGNKDSIRGVARKFKPDVESMEGAAFLFACKAEGIPCAQIRAISNFVEPRNTKNWDIQLAIENLNRVIVEILEELR